MGGGSWAAILLLTCVSARTARSRFSIRRIPPSDLKKWLLEADVIFHLAGVNRPQDPIEFETGNAGLTEQDLPIPAGKPARSEDRLQLFNSG